MLRLAVQATLGANLDVDSCGRCRAFWFEPFETIHLAPASTLQLFRLIADGSKSGAAQPFPTQCYCPKCSSRLLLTHDMQRTTRFQYWRCDHGHGRFTPYVDFLREKDFIKPLSPQQITELRESVQTINCANCGGAIDLTHDSTCPHCGSPLSFLDIPKMAEVAQQLQRPAAAPHPDLTKEQLAVTTLITLQNSREHRDQPVSLVDLGLQAVAGWLRDLVD